MCRAAAHSTGDAAVGYALTGQGRQHVNPARQPAAAHNPSRSEYWPEWRRQIDAPGQWQVQLLAAPLTPRLQPADQSHPCRLPAVPARAVARSIARPDPRGAAPESQPTRQRRCATGDRASSRGRRGQARFTTSISILVQYWSNGKGSKNK